MLPRMTNEEILAEMEELDRVASQYRHPDGQLTRDEFIEQGVARLIVQLMLAANAIDDECWEPAIEAMLPVGGWAKSLAAACVGKMTRDEVIDMMRRREEIAQKRPLKVVVDLGNDMGVVLGPDDISIPDTYEP
jgi:hypothetical protein